MNILETYGWNTYFQNEYNKLGKDSFETGRVLSIKGFQYKLISISGEMEAELSGRLLYGTETGDLPKVGDWVVFLRYDQMGYILEILPRINELTRRNPGTQTERQILAVNIDYALIVQGLDRDFNIMRLERYLVQISACNIQPIVLLNKSDLLDERDKHLQEVSQLGRNCPVHFCSTYSGEGLSELKNILLKPQKTYLMAGSSGVGKSSILNSLMGNTERETGKVSESTGKGKHVTTTRDLFLLPNGSLMIDTPGMREFGITFEAGQPTDGIFPRIDQLAKQCRYQDCRHMDETGCAVREAYELGRLEPEVYESYLKLMKEQKHFAIKMADKKRLGKQFGKMIREVREYRKKYKY